MNGFKVFTNSLSLFPAVPLALSPPLTPLPLPNSPCPSFVFSSNFHDGGFVN